MKFTKGVILGSIVTAGTIMMYSDMDRKKLMKKGKQAFKKIKSYM